MKNTRRAQRNNKNQLFAIFSESGAEKIVPKIMAVWIKNA